MPLAARRALVDAGQSRMVPKGAARARDGRRTAERAEAALWTLEGGDCATATVEAAGTRPRALRPCLCRWSERISVEPGRTAKRHVIVERTDSKTRNAQAAVLIDITRLRRQAWLFVRLAFGVRAVVAGDAVHCEG